MPIRLEIAYVLLFLLIVAGGAGIFGLWYYSERQKLIRSRENMRRQYKERMDRVRSDAETEDPAAEAE